MLSGQRLIDRVGIELESRRPIEDTRIVDTDIRIIKLGGVVEGSQRLAIEDIGDTMATLSVCLCCAQ